MSYNSKNKYSLHAYTIGALGEVFFKQQFELGKLLYLGAYHVGAGRYLLDYENIVLPTCPILRRIDSYVLDGETIENNNWDGSKANNSPEQTYLYELNRANWENWSLKNIEYDKKIDAIIMDTFGTLWFPDFKVRNSNIFIEIKTNSSSLSRGQQYHFAQLIKKGYLVFIVKPHILIKKNMFKLDYFDCFKLLEDGTQQPIDIKKLSDEVKT